MLSLKELENHEVVRITQENMVNMMRFWNELSNQIQVMEDGKSIRVQSALPHPLFNNVLKTEICEDIEVSIRKIILDYKNGQTHFLWRVWDHDEPSNLGTLLQENGAQVLPSTTLMAIDVQAFHPLTELNDSLVIKPLRNRKLAEDFTACCSTTFDIPEPLWNTITVLFEKQDQSFENLIGYLNGKPVSTASMFYDNGIAGIYNVATLPEYQGKGIGMEIMTALLLKAKLDGYKTAILHATSAGLRLYEKLGFEKYGEMKQYLF